MFLVLCIINVVWHNKIAINLTYNIISMLAQSYFSKGTNKNSNLSPKGDKLIFLGNPNDFLNGGYSFGYFSGTGHP